MKILPGKKMKLNPQISKAQSAARSFHSFLRVGILLRTLPGLALILSVCSGYIPGGAELLAREGDSYFEFEPPEAKKKEPEKEVKKKISPHKTLKKARKEKHTGKGDGEESVGVKRTTDRPSKTRPKPDIIPEKVRRTGRGSGASSSSSSASSAGGSSRGENDKTPSGASGDSSASNAAPGETSAKKPARHRGFHRGVIYLSFMAGMTLSAKGSLLDHEERYDEIQRYRTWSGQLTQSFFGAPFTGPTFRMETSNQPIGQMDLEYGISSHFGMGFSLFHFKIRQERQDQTPGFFVSNSLAARSDYVDAFPREGTLYQGTGLLYQFTYHPLSRSGIDPYIALRAGVSGFGGNAHQYLSRDMLREDTRINNGVGLVAGAGLGLNVFMGGPVGFRVEATVYRQALQADIFSRRGLSSAHLQVGLVMNLEAVSVGN